MTCKKAEIPPRAGTGGALERGCDPKLNEAQLSSLDDTQCLGLGQDRVSGFLTARPWLGIVAPLPSVPPLLV